MSKFQNTLKEQLWYFVTKIVLPYCEKKCFSDREFAKILRSLKKIIQPVKGPNNYWQHNAAFLTCSWRFLISNKLEQSKLKLEKNYWDLETCRKS